MEWIQAEGETLDAAKEQALDLLGIGLEDAEFEVLEVPRKGLFGRLRGNARVRARVKPAMVRPKQDRRNRRRNDSSNRRSGRPERSSRSRSSADGNGGGQRRGNGDGGAAPAAATATADDAATVGDGAPNGPANGHEANSNGGERSGSRRSRRGGRRRRGRGTGEAPASNAADSASADPTDEPTASSAPSNDDGGTERPTPRQRTKESQMSDDNDQDLQVEESPVSVDEVRQAAETFSVGLVEAFGLNGTASSTVDGTEIDVRVDGEGDGLGLLIGPGGRTLAAIQDLARVSAQRRLGDHETRLRIDIAGYREKRRAALEKFARHVAELVTESGTARSLDPMTSADRKVVHDTLAAIDGVSSRSEGDDPNRRIVVSPV